MCPDLNIIHELTNKNKDNIDESPVGVWFTAGAEPDGPPESWSLLLCGYVLNHTCYVADGI